MWFDVPMSDSVEVKIPDCTEQLESEKLRHDRIHHSRCLIDLFQDLIQIAWDELHNVLCVTRRIFMLILMVVEKLDNVWVFHRFHNVKLAVFETIVESDFLDRNELSGIAELSFEDDSERALPNNHLVLVLDLELSIEFAIARFDANGGDGIGMWDLLSISDALPGSLSDGRNHPFIIVKMRWKGDVHICSPTGPL